MHRDTIIQEARNRLFDNKYIISEINKFEDLSENLIDDILAIYSSRLDSKSTAYIRECFDNGDTYVLAFDKKTKKLAAFGRYLLFSNINNSLKKDRMKQYIKNLKIKNNFIFIADLASVAPGAGRAVMNFILAKASKLKIPTILLPWRENRDKLIPYYESLGFDILKFHIKGFPRLVAMRK